MLAFSRALETRWGDVRHHSRLVHFLLRGSHGLSCHPKRQIRCCRRSEGKHPLVQHRDQGSKRCPSTGPYRCLLRASVTISLGRSSFSFDSQSSYLAFKRFGCGYRTIGRFLSQERTVLSQIATMSLVAQKRKSLGLGLGAWCCWYRSLVRLCKT